MRHNAEFKIFKKLTRKKNAFDTFVRAQGKTQCILVSNSEFKHNFIVFTRKLNRAPLKKA